MENRTNPVLVHRGEVHTASSSLSHPSIDLMINCFDDHNSDDHHYLNRFDCLIINLFDDHSRDDHSHNLVIVWCGLSGSISMLAMYFSRRSFSSLRLSRLVMLLALRERDDQLPFIIIVIIVRIAMITIASYCSPLRESVWDSPKVESRTEVWRRPPSSPPPTRLRLWGGRASQSAF